MTCFVCIIRRDDIKLRRNVSININVLFFFLLQVCNQNFVTTLPSYRVIILVEVFALILKTYPTRPRKVIKNFLHNYIVVVKCFFYVY